MADIIDAANDRAEMERENNVARARERAALIPIGEPGDCELCGEWSGRLVRGTCAPCRDKLRLP